MKNHTLPDVRYAIAAEFCGWPTAMYVLRFAGDFVGSHKYQKDAETAAWDHHGTRMATLSGGVPVPLGMERSA